VHTLSRPLPVPERSVAAPRTVSRARAAVAAGLLLLALGVAAAAASVGGAVRSDHGEADPRRSGGRSAGQVLAGWERTGAVEAQAGVVPLAGTGLVDRSSWADADGDGVPDRVEEALCGSATCAVPWADVDGDGVPDAVDVLVCGTAGCVDARVDADADRIPDFAGALLCGVGGCPTGALRGDVDGDGVENWVEALIAGDATGATGREDLDGDGVADSAALMECLRLAGRLAATGAEAWWLLAAACAAGGTGLVLRGWRDLRGERVGTSKGVAA
jgi:hypothetical protein